MKRIDYTEMKRMRDSGMRNAEIASRLGCSEASVIVAIRRFGWPKREQGQSRMVNVLLLHQLWAQGLSAGEIGRRMGVCTTTVSKWAQRYKLPARPPQVTLESEAPSQEDEVASQGGLALSPWVAQRAQECRERHYAERRGETDETTLQWRRGGAAWASS